MINIREKGAGGERVIADALNGIIWRVLESRNMEHKYQRFVQRNSNQTAVGGKDLSNTFKMAIEVKCQEALAVNSWWKQCESQAKRNMELPVLLYKQNYKGWKCVTLVSLWLENGKPLYVRAELSYEDFLRWFEMTVTNHLESGGTLTV